MTEQLRIGAQCFTGLLIYTLRLRALAKLLPPSVRTWCDVGLYSLSFELSRLAKRVTAYMLRHMDPPPSGGQL